MRKDLIIFGIGQYADQANFYFSSDGIHRVAAFTVDEAFIAGDSFCGCPVIPFEEIAASFGPSTSAMFIAIGYQRVNAVRAEKYRAAKANGYRLASYVHPTALVSQGVQVGDNSLIGEMSLVRPFAQLGNNVQIGAQAHVGHHAIVHDHCWLVSQSVICGSVEIGESCFIGANATIRNHVKVGQQCVVGAGAVILSDCAPGGVYRAAATPRLPLNSSALSRI
jgi:sugar O-acyltransferase (sialic acid O-acetyltransferase NeuD family)